MSDRLPEDTSVPMDSWPTVLRMVAAIAASEGAEMCTVSLAVNDLLEIATALEQAQEILSMFEIGINRN